MLLEWKERRQKANTECGLVSRPWRLARVSFPAISHQTQRTTLPGYAKAGFAFVTALHLGRGEQNDTISTHPVAERRLRRHRRRDCLADSCGLALSNRSSASRAKQPC